MAANLLSPEVHFQETDLTVGTTAVPTSVGGFVGEFVWGPTNDVNLISNESQLVSYFGKPTAKTYASFFSAKNFLDYTNALKLIRVATAGQKNAVATGTALTIGNQDTYNALYSNGEATVGMFAAKYPGVLGNSLTVSMADAATYSTTLTGTISVTANSNVLTGIATKFTEQLTVGSWVSLTVSTVSTMYQVTAITSDTSATVTDKYATTTASLTGTAKWEYYALFSGKPVDSNQALSINASNDGLHMVVVDTGGLFTGIAGNVLEKFSNVSKASNALAFDGSSGYYKTVLNSGSSYIWWMDHPLVSDVGITGTSFGSQVVAGAFASLLKPITRTLTSGLDGASATDGELMLAWDIFKNAELVSVSLLITGMVSTTVSQYVVQNVAQTRMDCLAFISPNTAGAPIVGNTPASLDALVTWYNTVGVNSSYGVADSGCKYQYDKYNDVYRWIPLNADIAGLCAYTDSVAATWYSPAGLNRGQIKNVTRLAFNPSKTDRDVLFSLGINPVVSFPGQGTVLFGDKTTLSRPSAFNEIGIRRLFITLEQSIAASSKSFLFEQNTDLTRRLFQAMITPLLRDIQGRQGITDFYIDMGSTVNTPDTIDAGELRANILIKPVHSIRFISLNFIATRTSASFTEIQL